MTRITDEAESAFVDAYMGELLSRVDTASLPSHAAVRAGLLATLPHLTDDGATAPPAVAPAAERATVTVAPSSPHLRDALEKRLGALPVMAYSNGYMVEALPKAELMGLLAAHPVEGATPAIDREALRRLLTIHGVTSGRSYTRQELSRYRDDLTEAILALIGGAS